jgi:hypothetical protein
MGILTGDSYQFKSIYQRVYLCFSGSFKPALKTIRWLLSLMIPISFAVMLLDYSGILFLLAQYTAPFVKLLGLRGEAALVLLSGGLLNIYSAVAVIETINFTSREICIMAVMCLIAHNLIIETAVQKKTGSSAVRMVVLRIGAAITGGMLLNLLLPTDNTVIVSKVLQQAESLPFLKLLENWGIDTLKLVLKIICIIYLLNFLQRILDEFSITIFLSKLMTPVLRFFGLPLQSAFMWLIANIIGLAWGSSILIEQTEQGKITKEEADLLNHHIAISHSLLEDTLLFVAIGASVFWITIPRLGLAFIAVWVYRFIKSKMKS